MAKARGTAVDVEAQVRPILVAAAGGDVKLLGAGDPAPLLPSKTGANKPVYERLTAGDRPLVSVRKDGKAEVATLTADGFLAALPHLSAERVGELARRHADKLPAAERLDFLLKASESATGESVALLSAAVDVTRADAEAQAEADARRRRAEAEIIDRLLALKQDDIQRLHGELAAAEAMVGRLGGEVRKQNDAPKTAEPSPTPPRPAAGGPLVPTDPADLPFRRQVLQRLATAWAEAFENRRDEGRRYLEAAIHNLRGVRPVGEPDEEVPFDGVVHRASRAVSDGQPVRVVRPGWVLDEDGHRFVVLPAEVD